MITKQGAERRTDVTLFRRKKRSRTEEIIATVYNQSIIETARDEWSINSISDLGTFLFEPLHPV